MKTLSDMNEMLVAYLEATKDVEAVVKVDSYVVNIDNECVCTYTYVDSLTLSMKPLRCGTFCVFCIVPQPTSNHL